MAIPSRCARGTNRRPRRAEVVVLGHRLADEGDGRGLPHRREVAVGCGAVGAIGDGLRGGHHELDAGAAIQRYVGATKDLTAGQIRQVLVSH